MKTKWLVLVAMGAFFSLAQACGGDDESAPLTTGGTTAGAAGDTSAAGSGSSGTSGGAVIKDGTNIAFSGQCTGAPPYGDQNCLNTNCPDVYKNTPVLNEAGDCCKRVNLVTANEAIAADQKVYEYRLMALRTITQPESLGNKTNQDLIEGFQNTKAFITLYRFTGDLSKDGKIKYTIGPGVYNCDGTYSFYAKGAASAVTASTWSADPDRFAPTSSEVDWYAADGRIDTTWENMQKGVTGQAIYDYSTNKTAWQYAYELPGQGYAPWKIPITANNPDCIGSRSESAWNNEGIFEDYFRMDLADKITNLQGAGNPNETLCQLAAFFLLKQGDEKTTTCNGTPRCDRTTDPSCVWYELPDGLCPKDSEEENLFRCHLGDKKKADKLMAVCNSGQYTDEAPKEWCVMMKKWPSPPCTNTAPTSLADTPQCCDPLAKNTDGLPACNAWRVVNKYAAAAVEITSEPTSKLQTSCR